MPRSPWPGCLASWKNEEGLYGDRLLLDFTCESKLWTEGFPASHRSELWSYIIERCLGPDEPPALSENESKESNTDSIQKGSDTSLSSLGSSSSLGSGGSMMSLRSVSYTSLCGALQDLVRTELADMPQKYSEDTVERAISAASVFESISPDHRGTYRIGYFTLAAHLLHHCPELDSRLVGRAIALLSLRVSSVYEGSSAECEQLFLTDMLATERPTLAAHLVRSGITDREMQTVTTSWARSLYAHTAPPHTLPHLMDVLLVYGSCGAMAVNFSLFACYEQRMFSYQHLELKELIHKLPSLIARSTKSKGKFFFRSAWDRWALLQMPESNLIGAAASSKRIDVSKPHRLAAAPTVLDVARNQVKQEGEGGEELDRVSVLALCSRIKSHQELSVSHRKQDSRSSHITLFFFCMYFLLLIPLWLYTSHVPRASLPAAEDVELVLAQWTNDSSVAGSALLSYPISVVVAHSVDTPPRFRSDEDLKRIKTELGVENISVSFVSLKQQRESLCKSLSLGRKWFICFV